jgi:LuxR family maltose regulon positive regulatory protein
MLDNNGQAFIDWLRQTHLFVIPLDENQHWFRYHQLFQQLLQNQLAKSGDAERIPTMHRLAGSWYTDNGHIDDAIRHTLDGGDTAGAARLVAQYRQHMLDLDRWYILERWLSLFNTGELNAQAGLALARCWVMYHQFDITALSSAVDAAEAHLETAADGTAWRDEINFFRGYLCYFQNDGTGSLQHLDRARSNCSHDQPELLGQIEILHGLACQMQGQPEQTVQTLTTLLHRQRPSENIRTTRQLVTLVYIQIIAGRLDAARQANQQLEQVAEENDFTYAKAWSIYLSGLISFYQNDLDAAVDHFRHALEHKYILHTRAAIDAMAGLAYACQGLGLQDDADDTINMLSGYVSHVNAPGGPLLVRTIRIRLSLLRGEAVSASHIANTSPAAENMVWWLEIPAVTHCRHLITEGTRANLETAEAHLRDLLRVMCSNHNDCQMIQMLPLLAVVCRGLKRADEAAEILERAVGLAAPDGWVQPFAELGHAAEELLKTLQRHTARPEFVASLLTAAKWKDRAAASHPTGMGASTAALAAPRSQVPQPLIEPLTNRELDVLELLDQRLQNKEIAEKLFISTETVKAHLKNIYQKLSVSKRREAVIQARKLGILPF